MNRRNFINLKSKTNLSIPVLQDRPKISKYSQALAKKRFLDVDLDGERESLDSLILEFEMGKISAHTPIHERLYNEVFHSLEKKREYERLSEKIQVQGCKFSPSISKRNLQPVNGSTDFGERLSK